MEAHFTPEQGAPRLRIATRPRMDADRLAKDAALRLRVAISDRA